MMPLIYDFFLQCYRLLILIASVWNAKARAWVHGRRGLFTEIEDRLKDRSGVRIWMHCASFGEFEQGRPVLEAIRSHWPDTVIILTFFSPSGYEHRKTYPGADLITYLPLDTRQHADRFVSAVHPALAIFVKYEHWHHHLQALERRGIPALLISSIFRPEQPFFKPWGGVWRGMLHTYDRIFVQDDRSASLLQGIGLADRVEVAGDTRFDRVCRVAEVAEEVPGLSDVTSTHFTLVAGSTWPADETLLATYVHSDPEVRCIIAPHEISPARLTEIERNFPDVIRFSDWQMRSTSGEGPAWRTLLIDNIGMLSRLYRYGQVAYVGGGFHKAGIHNILEAAVYGLPVLFGPRHGKAREASELRHRGGAFTITDDTSLRLAVDRLKRDVAFRTQTGEVSRAYVWANVGATRLIMHCLQGYLRSNS